MPGVVRMPDVDSGGHPNITSSPDTFTNSLKTTRIFDVRTCYGADLGTHTVFVNSRDIQVCGDPVTSGCVQVQCSSNVFADG